MDIFINTDKCPPLHRDDDVAAADSPRVGC